MAHDASRSLKVMTRNHNIDALKAICALLIVSIHCTYAGKFYLDPLAKIAVPCFFMISGYCIYEGDSGKLGRRLAKAAGRVAYILVWASLVFCIMPLYSYWRTGANEFHFAWSNLWLNTNPFCGHLWYLQAYLYVLLVAWLLNRAGRIALLPRLAPVLLLCGLALGSYSCLLAGKPLASLLTRNFLFIGLPFFSIGMWLRRHATSAGLPAWLGSRWMAAAILALLLLSVGEKLLVWNFAHRAYDLYVTTIVLSVLVFCLTVTRGDVGGNWLSAIGQRYSLYIYVYHMLILQVAGFLASKFMPAFTSNYLVGNWLLVVFPLTLALVAAGCWLKTRMQRLLAGHRQEL